MKTICMPCLSLRVYETAKAPVSCALGCLCGAEQGRFRENSWGGEEEAGEIIRRNSMWVSDMIIRKGKKADFKAIAKLWLSFFTDTPDVPDSYSARHAKRGELLVAVEGNKVIGFLEFSKNHFFESDYIEAVIVGEQFRGKGVATSLLMECERQAKKRDAGGYSAPLNRGTPPLSRCTSIWAMRNACMPII